MHLKIIFLKQWHSQPGHWAIAQSFSKMVVIIHTENSDKYAVFENSDKFTKTSCHSIDHNRTEYSLSDEKVFSVFDLSFSVNKHVFHK